LNSAFGWSQVGLEFVLAGIFISSLFSRPEINYLLFPISAYTRIMNIRVIVEFDSEVQAYAAYCPELPGCTSAGMTEEEALDNIREAVELFFTPDDKPIENRRVYQISV
jgi:predicted RNase H-like HicB family nuclease